MLFNMAPYKALGTTCLHACFYEATWDITNLAMHWFVYKLLQDGTLLRAANDTLIALVLKTLYLETLFEMRQLAFAMLATS